MVQSQNLAITGELIVSMPESERHFEVIDKPRYEAYPTQQDPSGEKNKKLAVLIKLSNEAQGIYYPNKTSANRMTTLCLQKLGNTEMDNWVGQKFYWGNILKQKIGSGLKDVLYVTDFWPVTSKS